MQRTAARLQIEYTLRPEGRPRKTPLARAAVAYRHVVRLQPRQGMARNFPGNVLRKSGRPAEAEPQYREAVRLKADYAGTTS